MTASINDLLITTTAEALGSMFFTPVTRRAKVEDIAEAAGSVFVRIPFLVASRSGGYLDLGVSAEGAQSIASSFLAEDDRVPEYQVDDVICELANVICGSALSVLLCDQGFRLLSPEVLREAYSPGTGSACFEEVFDLESGWLSVRLNLGSTL